MSAPGPSTLRRSKRTHSVTANAEEDEYVAMDELSQTIPLPGGSALAEVEEESEEEAVHDPDDPDISGSEMEAPSLATQEGGRPKRVAATNALKNVSSWMRDPEGRKEAKEEAARKEAEEDGPVVAKGKRKYGRGEVAEEDILDEDADGLKSPDGLPVYGRKTLTFAAAEQLLLVPDATHENKDTVCTSIPVYCPNQKGGFTFLIDAAALYQIADLPVDGYGSWTAGGSRASSRSRYYMQMANGDLMRVDSTIKHNREPKTWDLKLTQTRYVHPAAARCFRKLTYCVRDREGGVKRWAAVTYQWLSEPFSFKPLPHGNCKGGKKELKPFQRTYPSVLAAMKQQLPVKMPKTVLEDIQGALGVTGADQPLPALPRNRKQLYNLNRGANRDFGEPIDHRKWRKTGPAAGRPPGVGEMGMYAFEDDGQYDVEDIHYVIEDSEIPEEMLLGAESLVNEEGRFKDSEENPQWCSVEDGGRHLGVRADPTVDGRFRCSDACDEFRSFRHICRHTLAVAQRRGKMAEHLNFVRLANAGGVEVVMDGEGVLVQSQDPLQDPLPDPHPAPSPLHHSPFQLVHEHQVLMGREEIVVAAEGDDFPSNIMMTN